MTREEEINNVSENYGNEKYSDGVNSLICAEDFRNGAHWADQHPREGLWDAKKVCDFIEENIDNYLYINRDWNAPQIKSNFIEDLHKAMEN